MSKIRVDYLETLDGTKTIKVSDIGSGGSGPGGNAGGVLSGSYPNPGFAVPMATQSSLNTLSVSKQDKLLPATTVEMQLGGETAIRAMSPKNISEAIQALAPGGSGGGGSPSGPAGGVLSGSYPNPAFAVPMATSADLTSGLAGKASSTHTHTLAQLDKSGATTGQSPVWNGSGWVPQTISGGGSGAKPAFAKLKNLESPNTTLSPNAFHPLKLSTAGAVSLNGAVIDAGSPSWIRVPRAGYYRISFGVMVLSTATANTGMFARAYANSSPLFDGSSSFSPGPAMGMRSNGSDVVYLQANAAISVEIYISNGTCTLTDTAEKTSNWLTVEELPNVL